jgi:hypothetical protein
MNNEVKPDYGTSYDKGANPWIVFLGIMFLGYIGYTLLDFYFPENKKAQLVRVFRTQYKGDSVVVLLTDSGAQVLEVTGGNRIFIRSQSRGRRVMPTIAPGSFGFATVKRKK